MFAGVQPPAPLPATDRPARANARRLRELRVICELLGLIAMVNLGFALLATPLGAVIFGTLAAVQLAMAVVLWLRLRAGWYAVMGMLGLGFVLGFTYFALDPGRTGIFTCMACLLTGLFVWSWRRWFLEAEAPRPRLVSGDTVRVLGVVLLVGGGVLAWMVVDDPRRSFPALEAQVPTPPEQENGYLFLQQMLAKWPERNDPQLNKVLDGLPKAGARPSAEWLAGARAVVQRLGGCRADVRQLVRKPHFVEVPQLSGSAWTDQPREWLSSTRQLARLLTVSAVVQAADQRWSVAVDEADLTVSLGMLTCKESSSVLQSMVGVSVIRMGLRSLRDVAARVTDGGLLRAHLGPPLSEEELRQGYNLGLAGELQYVDGALDEVSWARQAASEVLRAKGSGPLPPGLLRRVRRSTMIKDNMTHNFLAGILSEDTIQAGEHVPSGPRAAAGETAFASAARRAGYLHLARNPVGDTLAAMLAPAMARSREEIPKAIADARTTQVYLALRCYQLEHGRLPEKLDALAPEYLKAIPLDPFTGKPFGYEPVGQKPRIWSVGPDQRTDPPDAEEGDDVVVPIEFVGP